MAQLNKHWTDRSTDDFLYSIGAGFIRQLEKEMPRAGATQANLAKALGVSQGRVSQIFNNPGNLTLRKMIEYSRALGCKLALVVYDDGDADNKRGLIGGEIFTSCWEMAGRPSDFFELREGVDQATNPGTALSRVVEAATTTAVFQRVGGDMLHVAGNS